MKSQELRDKLVSKGWKPDNYGHLKLVTTGKKTGNPVLLRVKFQETSARLEKQITIEAGTYSKEKKEWFKLSSDYYKNISLDDTGKIKIGIYRI